MTSMCTRCKEQQYDETSNPTGVCMSCHGTSMLIEGRMLDVLPPHHIVEEGINAVGQRYVRLRYVDGSEDLIDPLPWEGELSPEDLGGDPDFWRADDHL